MDGISNSPFNVLIQHSPISMGLGPLEHRWLDSCSRIIHSLLRWITGSKPLFHHPSSIGLLKEVGSPKQIPNTVILFRKENKHRLDR